VDRPVKKKGSFLSFLSYWKEAPTGYRQVLIGLLIFAIVNSSDLFLILRLKETGMSDTWVIGGFIFYNLIYAVFALPLGILADRIGLKKIFIFGLFVFVCVYFGMAMQLPSYLYLILFGGYGIFSAATEGVGKAWISNISDQKDTATAIGLFAGLQSVCTFLASSIAGMIWYAYGASVAFTFTAIVVIGVILYFVLLRVSAKPSETTTL
jgi:MFS family permease